MNAPAFQFYVDDFIGGTVDLTVEDVGAYIRLLCYQWSRGAIPETAEKIERVAGGPVSADVLAKFPGGKNVRLELERDKQAAWREVCSENGKRGGGNPAFQKGRPNPYYPQKDKGEDKGGISQDKAPLSLGDKGRDKGEINSPLSTLHSSLSISSTALHPPTNGESVCEFEKFWEAYPKKKNRIEAERAFFEIGAKENLPAILAAIVRQKRLPDWQREAGRFIPLPANWLRDGRWADEAPKVDHNPPGIYLPT